MNESTLITGMYNGAAPQDWATEVAPVERQLRDTLDASLRIVWNPKAFLSRVGSYDAEGRAIPPLYEGRYQVVIPGKLDGVDTVVHTLGAEEGPHKPYKPVGEWLVTFMREWDTANVHQMEAMQRMQRESDALESALAIAAAERRQESNARFATDVLGLKPIMAPVATDLH